MNSCITDRPLRKQSLNMARSGQIRKAAQTTGDRTMPILSRGSRILCTLAGLVFVALAALGVIIPGLPTTPFLLLAAALFTRSSPKLYGWLHQSAIFGRYLRDWKTYHAIPRHVRFVTVLMVGGGLTFTWLWSAIPIQLQILNTVLCLIGLTVVFRLPVR